MELIKQCKYVNDDLVYGDIVIIDGYRLGMVKSTYKDGKTDCSWHYVQVSKDDEVDIQGSEIIYKLVGDGTELIKNMILTGHIGEDKDKEKINILNNIAYYENQIEEAKSDLISYERLLELEKSKLKD